MVDQQGRGVMRKNKAGLISILISASIFAAGSAWADGDIHLFAAPMASFIWFNGDFDGTRTVSGGGETMVIPAVTPGLGYGGIIGFEAPFGGWDGFKASVEAQGIYAPLMGTFSSESYEVIYFNLEAQLAVFYAVYRPFYVYAKAGVGLTWITVVDGATNATETGNFVIDGVDMNGGAGISVELFGIAELRAGVAVHLSNIVHGSGIEISGSMEAVDDSPFIIDAALLFKF
jgi:hypothetical protein